jgi:Resolvase, N terminal domain
MSMMPDEPDETPRPRGGPEPAASPSRRQRRDAGKKRPPVVPTTAPELAPEGGADLALRRNAHLAWLEAARAAGVDLTHFDPDATLEQRIAWALGLGLLVACVYTRFSSKTQHSTDDQVRAVVQFAARNAMYVAPELICTDEAAKGRRIRRVGLDRLKAILKARRATVLLVYKASRLFRQAGEGFRLIK